MSDHDKIYSTKFQDTLERKTVLLFVMIALAVAVGGIVEIVPLFYLPNTAMCAGALGGTDPTCNGTQHKDKAGNAIPMDKIIWNPATSAHKTLEDWVPGDGVRPYKPLELAGRAIYIREGCFLCHSQMIRPFRAETERFGHYSVAGEFVYDHPFQWGSKRTGPDLARVGGRYSDQWHRIHLLNPRDVVPESNMPAYYWLNRPLKEPNIKAKMEALSKIFYTISARVYQNVQQEQQAGQQGGQQPGQQSGQSKQNEDGTIDAEYKIVDEDEKKP